MKAITKNDVALLRDVQKGRVTWERLGHTYQWRDVAVPESPRCKRLVGAGMLVDPDTYSAEYRAAHRSGPAEVTGLGARVLVVYDEHLATHRDADVALSRTTLDWKADRL